MKKSLSETELLILIGISIVIKATRISRINNSDAKAQELIQLDEEIEKWNSAFMEQLTTPW